MDITWGSNNPCFLVLLCASLLLLLLPRPTSSTHDHVALFIFGDSLYDVGNNNYLKNPVNHMNIIPYGETFFKHPTGRASNGRLIPDFIAEFAKLPLLPPYLKPGSNYDFINGVNFASGGAGALVETNQGFVISFQTQLSYLKDMEKKLRQKLGDSKAKKLLSKAVYIFSIGSNDCFVPFTANSSMLHSYTKKEYVKMVVGNITAGIQEIYKLGGRKFGLSKFAAVGCVPALRALKLATTGSSGCTNEATVLAKLHNKALSKALRKLDRDLPGFMYSLFDVYTAVKCRFKHPSKYGFKEVKTACCGSGPYRGVFSCGRQKGYQLCDNVDDYFFFDAVHPTEKADFQLAELMWSGSPYIVRPYNLKTLFRK